jgi:protein subunit release factor A
MLKEKPPIFIDAKDLVINTDPSNDAVQVIHKPTGLITECNTYKSYFKNKIDALMILKEKLGNLELESLKNS